MKTVVLHDRYTNNPVVVRPEAIAAIRKVNDFKEEEYSNIIVDTVMIDVKECIRTVITKIEKAENEGSSE